MNSNATCYRGKSFKITFNHEDGTEKVIELTYDEWLEFRRLQNSLFFTEPT